MQSGGMWVCDEGGRSLELRPKVTTRARTCAHELGFEKFLHVNVSLPSVYFTPAAFLAVANRPA